MSESSRTTTVKSTFQSNPKARLGLILMGALVLAIFGFAVLSLMRSGPDANAVASLPPPPKGTNTPGNSGDPRYDKLQEEENRRKAAEAAERGTSSLPTLVGPQNTTPDPLLTVQTPVQPTPQTVPTPTFQQPAAVQSPRPTANAAPSNYGDAEKQMAALLKGWGAPEPSQEFDHNGQAAAKPAATAVAATTTATAAPAAQAAPARKGPSLIRAGTIVPAVLLSSLDSDNPGPVLAQIVSGPLAGTRVIGQFQSSDNKLVLTFHTLSSPTVGSYSITAYAIDDKQQVGMATDVNSHAFKRYSLLLASSLLAGYGEAVGRSNTTVVTGPFGSTTSQGELSDKQIAGVALGEMGKTVAQELAQNGKIKPTVRLSCDGGCSIGLLFLSDL